MTKRTKKALNRIGKTLMGLAIIGLFFSVSSSEGGTITLSECLKSGVIFGTIGLIGGGIVEFTE